MTSRPAALIGIAVLLFAACSNAVTPSSSPPSSPPASAAASVDLTVFGAASLKAVLAKVKGAYGTADPGVTLTISTGSSAALETQIEQGAPADVFLSADTTNPQKLVTNGLASGDPVAFAANMLTLIVPTANPGRIESPADLGRSDIKVIAAGAAVPITKYANQLVANLAKQPGYPPAFVASYAANIVSREDDVAAVVAKVELGEGDAAIVYLTDAKTSTKVTSIAVPLAANVVATYAGVALKASKDAAAAEAFLTWLAGPDGQAILTAAGFLPPS